jgi:hypothetical protein
VSFVWLFFSVHRSQAQITNVTNDTATPIEGAGHDYIHMLSETVNPATGSVSLRIQIPVPKARGFTVPFSIAYDSNSVNHIVPGGYPEYGTASWTSNLGFLSQSGWSYSVPQLSYVPFTQTTYVLYSENNGQPLYNTYPCYYAANYVFRDGSAGLHSLYTGTDYASNVNGGGPQYCTLGGVPVTSGGDIQVTGTLTGTVGVGPGPGFLPVTVSDTDGTVYSFSGTVGSFGNPTTTYALPSTIEDRNGNVVTVEISGSSVTLTDTVGRPAVSISSFGGTTNTITTPEGAYEITWTSTSGNFSMVSKYAGAPNLGNGQCEPVTSGGGSETVVSQITLPDGQSYHFYYGTNNPNSGFQNPYGLLSEIDYPSGGWVRYTWKLSDTMNELLDYPGIYFQSGAYCGNSYSGCPAPIPDGCLYQYETPVVASRQVGFTPGTTAALIQTFQYSTTWAAPIGSNEQGTTWTQKTTNMTTTDNVANQSFLTTYSYSPITLAPQPFSNTNIAAQMAAEQTTTYYNTTTPSNALRAASSPEPTMKRTSARVQPRRVAT